MKLKYFLLYFLLFPFLSFAQQEGKRFDLRRINQTNLHPVEHPIKPKKEVFPLGYGTNHFGKADTGTGIWTELNPKVPRVDYLGIQFVNKDTGWAVGDLGALIKSTDGGTSWTVSETNTTTPLLKVRSYNGQVVIASGFGGLILRSTDGGETFTQVTSGVTGDLWGLQMLNDTLSWACGNANSLVKTTDDGQTWQTVSTSGYTSDYWWIDFLDENYGFIAANGKILRTTDGGNNWEIIQAGDAYPLFSLDVIDSLHIAAAGYGGTGYAGKNIYSSDGGNTWVTGGQLTNEAVNCIKYVNRDTGYVIMTNVIGKKTTNRGQDWTGIALGGEYEMQFINDENLGYSAGTELRIYKTENDYENWQRLIINDNFSDVFFVSEQIGFVISSSGLSAPSGLYKTIDRGISWEKVSDAPNGVDLLFLDSLTGFIGSNQIYKTTDGGVTWYVPNGGQGGAGKIFFINETIGWAVRSNVIYKTTDRGENWFTQLTIPSGSFTSIFCVDSLNGWATSSHIWQTTNGGNDWIERTNIPTFFLSDVYFTSIDTGFVIEFLDLYKTQNFGNNWFTQLNSPYIIRSFGWLSGTHGFIMGDGVYETIDKGNSWNEILALRNVGLRKFQAPKNYIGYSIGHKGLILRYDDGVTNISPNSENIIPDQFYLYQNFPNPFNPATKIKFRIPAVETHRDASLQVKLIVYDVLGNEIATLLNQEKPSGEYEVEFDGTNFPSGVYFCQLRAENYIQTIKMLLLK